MDKELCLKYYDPNDVFTWPHYPIVMPLKNKMGPASEEECDEIIWEVWDRLLDTHGSFKNLPQAINEAIKLNQEFLYGS